jgi:signal transduction histidine kinase
MWPATLFRNRSAKIAAAYCVALLLSFALLGTLTVFLTDAALHRQIDQKISAEMQRLITIEKTGGTDALALVQTQAETSEKTLLFRYTNPKLNLNLGNFTHVPQHMGWADVSVEPQTSQEQPDQFRVWKQPLGQGELSVASDLDEIENVTDTLAGAFITAGLVAALLALIGGLWFGHYNLKSINQLATTAEAVSAGELSQRMPILHGEDGFDRLSATLNHMLDRNAELLDNQKQITSNIAHDIRTPLTRLRQNLEKTGNRLALEETDRLLTILTALLRIAEIEEGPKREQFQRLDLVGVAQHTIEAYALSFEASGRTLNTEFVPEAWVEGDRDLLLQLFSNLFENLLAHTPKGTAALLTISKIKDHTCLTLSDDGLGVPAAELATIFRRFQRADLSRNSPGHGLGLALVFAISKLHQAELSAVNLNPGFQISLKFK